MTTLFEILVEIVATIKVLMVVVLACLYQALRWLELLIRVGAARTGTIQVLPMQLKLGDRLTDETGEYEVIGRPYMTSAGRNAHVCLKRVGSAVTMIRVWPAPERISVKRA
jgi:hypothetical protein